LTSRHRLLGLLTAGTAAALLAGALAVGSADAAPAPSQTSAPLQLTLPAPTGPDPIGTVSLHLVDHSRQDPWVPGHARELMISLWYPARDAGHYPTVPWMTPGAAAAFEQANGIPAGSVIMPETAGHDGAPVERDRGRLPVLLYSPGSGGDREVNTALVEQLASRGYLVVTIDHTYDADEVEFPGGRVEVRTMPPGSEEVNTQAVAVREADTRFVLDELTAIDHGADPDAEHHRLPNGLRGAMDLSRIGMFGHSMGGATAAATMHDDSRIAAGINMDGTFYGPVITDGLNRPFLLMSSQDHGRDNDQTWAGVWSHLTGWKLDLRLTGSQHLSFTDAEVLYPQVAPLIGIPPAGLTQLIGTIDQQRAMTIVAAYVDSYFDLQLRHHDDHLMDGPSAGYPEMQFIS
jgi:dienelactone hydrolase